MNRRGFVGKALVGLAAIPLLGKLVQSQTSPPMKANVECGRLAAFALTVYLNDEKLTDCIEGDEELGYVWVNYRDVDHRVVPAISALPGTLVYSDVQVVKRHGVVRFEIEPPKGMSADDVRAECNRRFVPIRPIVLS